MTSNEETTKICKFCGMKDSGQDNPPCPSPNAVDKYMHVFIPQKVLEEFMTKTNIDPFEIQFGEYQEKARETAIYDPAHRITYPLLGLVGEVGEFANKYKKVLRDGREFSRDDMASELGDILWYISNLAYDCGIGLDYIANHNLEKLNDRKDRGVLGGSGDNR